MGNTLDSKKDKEGQSSQNKQNHEMITDDNTEDYSIMFTKPVDPCLNQLLLWSLTEIRLLYERFRRKTIFPLIDRNFFCKLLDLSKQNSIFIFTHMTKVLKVMFNLFDFDGSKSIDFNELHMFYSSLITGVCRLTGSQPPSKLQIEKDAKNIFVRIDVAPYDQQLSFTEVKEWVESNSIAVKLFFRFEPNYKIAQKFTTMLGFKSYQDDQIDEILKYVLTIGTTQIENIEKLKEKIHGAMRPDKKENKLLLDRTSLDNSFDKSKINNPDSNNANNNNNQMRNSNFLPSNTNNTNSNNLNTNSNTYSQSTQNPFNFNRTFTSPKSFAFKKNFMSSISPKISMKTSYNPIELQRRSADSLKFPKIEKREISTTGMNSEYQRELLLQKKKELFAMSRSKRKNIIITNGSSITRHDAEKLKSYFNSLAEGRSTITLPNFVKAFSKSVTLQKVSASIFNFLDKNAHGEVTFPELIQRLYPSLTKDQLNQVIDWTRNSLGDGKYPGSFFYWLDDLRYPCKIGEETERQKRTTNNIYMKEVPKEAIKRMKQIYDLFDEENKGWVSMENLIKNFKNLFSPKEVEELFNKHDKDKDSKLSLQEFIEIILPPDYKVEPGTIEKYYKKAKA